MCAVRVSRSFSPWIESHTSCNYCLGSAGTWCLMQHHRLKCAKVVIFTYIVAVRVRVCVGAICVRSRLSFSHWTGGAWTEFIVYSMHYRNFMTTMTFAENPFSIRKFTRRKFSIISCDSMGMRMRNCECVCVCVKWNQSGLCLLVGCAWHEL